MFNERCFFCGALVHPSELLAHGEVCPALKENEKGRRRSTSSGSTPSEGHSDRRDFVAEAPQPPVPPEQPMPFSLSDIMDQTLARLKQETDDDAADALAFGTLRAFKPRRQPKKKRTIEDLTPIIRQTLEPLIVQMEGPEGQVRLPNAPPVRYDLELMLRDRGITWSVEENLDGTVTYHYVNGC